MATYALYIPSAHRQVAGVRMELFPSLEVAARVLRTRNTERRSRVFLLGAPRPRSVADWPVADFPLADTSGYMRVFLRRASDPAPALKETPDEEWVLRSGGRQGRGVVERLSWCGGDETLRVRGRTLTVTPPQKAELPRVRKLQCEAPRCPLVFEGPALRWAEFQALFMEHGWRKRGSVAGTVYFCPAHVPR